jgi:hypothetical protein
MIVHCDRSNLGAGDEPKEPSYSAIVYDRKSKRWVSNTWVSNSVSNPLNKTAREVRHDGRQAHSQAVNRHGSGNF